MVEGFIQFSLSEVQRTSIIGALTAHGDGSVKVPSLSELQQLQEELERIVQRTTARSTQLEKAQLQFNALRDKDAARAHEPRGKDITHGISQAAASTSTPSPDHPASKRVKLEVQAPKPEPPAPEVDQVEEESSVISSGTINPAGVGNGKRVESKDTGSPVPPKAKHSAGTPVQDDFSRVKIPNQVPIHQFWTSLDPYFRAITDEDLAYLESTPDDQESYVIPKLGRFYAYKWAEEEVALLKAESRGKVMPEKSFAGTDLVNSDMSLNSARLAPLTERIISALVVEQLLSGDDKTDGSGKVKSEDPATNHAGSRSDDGASDAGDDLRQLSSSGDAVPLEERLKRELRYIGILDDDDVNWSDREDDEVCVTLRSLQRQLHEQVKLNKARKERLLPIAKEYIGYQEYTQVIEELDKQVEQSYVKRHRLTKSRKRKSASVKPVALSDNAVNAMDRRRRVIQAIGHLFPAEKFALPTQSIF
ncbi:hypothetical protein DL89DRAFT_234695, partial [Linderina pennispora]